MDRTVPAPRSQGQRFAGCKADPIDADLPPDPAVAGGSSDLPRRTAVMAAGTIVSRLTGFGRVAALAYGIGFNNVSDAYALGNTTPNIVYELVLGGVLSATLVPVFVRAFARRDEPETEGAVDAVVSVAGVALAVLSVAFALAAPLIIGLYTLGDHSPEIGDQRAVAVRLLVLFAPQVAAYGAITLATALLNARRRFASPMWTPVLNNIVVIATLALFPHVAASTDDIAGLRADTAGLLLLGLGTTAGVVVQAVALVVAARRAGVRVRWRWEPGHPAVRRIVSLSGWTLGFVAANQVAAFVVILLANRGPQGDLVAYQGGYMFFLLPHSVFAVSIMSALLPDLAASWARADVDAFRRDVSVGLRTTAVVIVPAAAGYAVLATPIVRLVLEHGALSGGSAQTTADVLALLAIGLPGFSGFLFLTRAYNAMQDTRTLFWLYVAENGVNIALAVALHPALGVQGVALSYSAAYLVAVVLAAADLRRRIGGIDGARLAASLARIGVATAVMAAAVWAVRAAVGGGGSTALLAEVGGGVGTGVVVYVAVAGLLRLPELDSVARRVRSGRSTGAGR